MENSILSFAELIVVKLVPHAYGARHLQKIHSGK